MKYSVRKLSALALTIFFAATAQAAVTAISTSGDRSTWRFEDDKTGLIWTNGDAFPVGGLNFSDASAAAASLGNDWRLPTMAEFIGLYQDLGQVKQASLTTLWGGVFDTNGVQYWTSTPTSTDSANIRYFMPQNPITVGEPFWGKSKLVNTWAVSAIPEPEQWGMLMAGLGLIGVAIKRRKFKQI